MNILYGLYQPDEGSIEVDGSRSRSASPRDVDGLGIGMVHQHFMLVPDMTVAENVALGLRSSRPPLARLGEVSAAPRRALRPLRAARRPRTTHRQPPVAMQRARRDPQAAVPRPQLLILDEPTAVLTPAEWEELQRCCGRWSPRAARRSSSRTSWKSSSLSSTAAPCCATGVSSAPSRIRTTTDTATLARMMVGRDVVLRVDRPVVEPGRPC